MNKKILQGGQPSKKPRLKKAAFITSFILLAASLFARDVARIDEKKLFDEIAKNFDVTKIQMPDERSEYYEEQYVQFIKQYNGKTTKPRAQFTERGRTYTIEFFDFGTNVFYVKKALGVAEGVVNGEELDSDTKKKIKDMIDKSKKEGPRA